ncbi:MAG: hemerythrin domain-containing protein [Actinomycetota bacterium]|nr:hemerythrin domain-containing protein [Actinomycetota bacterium]
MDAIDFLTEQHRETESLFEDFLQTDDSSRRREIVDEIIEDLQLHTALEEEIFYPALGDAIPELKPELLEDFEEHHAVQLLLKELADMGPDHERFAAKVSVVKEHMQHHVEDEESELFPRVRDELDQDRLNELGRQLQQRAQRESHSQEELRERARELDIEGRSKMSKEELVEEIEERE